MNSSKITAAGDNRLAKWDNVKFLLIFLVVLGHVAKGFMGKSDGIGKIVYFIYLFHMPAFIFVSGLFSKRTVNEKRWDKISSFLIIFYFMKVLGWIVKTLGGSKPGFSLLSEYGIAWYVLGMVFFILITMVIKKYSFSVIMVLSILLGCIIGYDKSVGSFLSLSRVVTFYPFFYLGYSLDTQKLSSFLRKKVVVIASAGWVLTIIGLIWKYYEKVKWSYEYFLKGKGSFAMQFEDCPYVELVDNAWLVRMGYYLIVFVTVIAVIALVPSVTSMFSRFGSKTLQVYALHESFMYLFLTILGGKAWLGTLNMKLAFLLILGFSIILTVFLSTKLFTPLFSILVNGVKKEKRT